MSAPSCSFSMSQAASARLIGIGRFFRAVLVSSFVAASFVQVGLDLISQFRLAEEML